MNKNKTLSLERLDEIAALYAKATPGEWEVTMLQYFPCEQIPDNTWSIGSFGASAEPDFDNHIVHVTAPIQDYCRAADDDAALIAAMHNAIPELLRLARIGRAGDGIDPPVIGKIVLDSHGWLGVYGANIPPEWEGQRVRVLPVVAAEGE